MNETVAQLERKKAVSRIWSKDATLWKSDEAHAKIIANSLGWLRAPEEMLARVDEIVEKTEELRRGFEFVVVLGMGGSSLCAEVVRHAFRQRNGWPELLVLDSTVPEAVAILEKRLNLAKTLFIVASKSGTTTEPVMFHRYFYGRVKSLRDDAGQQFIAVTDPGTQLEADARRDGFRHTFINPPDIGGRYSALSLFGLVPMALAGVDIRELLTRAVDAVQVSRTPSIQRNAAARLGAAIGAAALAGHDKLTLITPKPFAALGLWIEQLVAESTGKEGKGIVPIAGEPQLDPASYGSDRIFAAIHTGDDETSARMEALAAAGHPVIDYRVNDALDLGEIFFVWEFATAIAGAVMEVNPFDQPNVQESKDNTKRLLGEQVATGSMGTGASPVAVANASDPIGALLGKVRQGDYVALTQYFGETATRENMIAKIRERIAVAKRVATTSGYGPRFLHSTGQLHKGGADNGVFIQLVGGPQLEMPIPDEAFDFAVLARAQAVGDLQSLAQRNRRFASIDLGEDVDAGLEKLLGLL